MQLVILAGGKGARLGLNEIPKPMCLVAGKPILEWQIELAKSYGITEIFILSGYLAHVISDYFGDGTKWGVKITHIRETKPLGTAGCMHLVHEQLDGRFLVFYGDVVMDFDISSFIKFDAQVPTLGTLFVHPNNHPYDSDILVVDKEQMVTQILSKPHPPGLVYRNIINAALYILSPEIINFIEPDISQDFAKDIFPKVLQGGKKLKAYHSAEYVRDMGTSDRLLKVSRDVESGKVARLNKRLKRPAIFLDRDGVLIKDMDIKPRAEDLTILNGVEKAIGKINASNYLCIIVTNQPMIAKGLVSVDEVESTNMMLETKLGQSHAFIDAIYYCPHHPERGFPDEVTELKIECNCRKPKIGMFLEAQSHFNIDMEKSWMIGDRETDILAGKAASCRTILVGDHKQNSTCADYQFCDLPEAVTYILEN